MIAGVPLDNYKLEVFKTILTREGYKFEVIPGPFPHTTTLRVEYFDLPRITRVINQCTAAALKLHAPVANTKVI